MNIVFFGTPEFARIILERLALSDFKPLLVLGSRNKIPLEKIRAMEVDLIIVAAYGRILTKDILDLPKYGALNIHPSLLPKYRGPSPIQYTILNGDKMTGVTIIKMDEEIDHGDIVSCIKYQVLGDETTDVLSRRLAKIGSELLVETIRKWIAGAIKPTPQTHSEATYTKIIRKEDAHINWNKSAEEIARQIRAFTPWPGSYFFWKDKRIKTISGNILDISTPQELLPGQTFLHNSKLAVQTPKGIFVIEELQLQGKNKITIKEFLNGYEEIIGAVLL